MNIPQLMCDDQCEDELSGTLQCITDAVSQIHNTIGNMEMAMETTHGVVMDLRGIINQHDNQVFCLEHKMAALSQMMESPCPQSCSQSAPCNFSTPLSCNTSPQTSSSSQSTSSCHSSSSSSNTESGSCVCSSLERIYSCRDSSDESLVSQNVSASPRFSKCICTTISCPNISRASSSRSPTCEQVFRTISCQTEPCFPKITHPSFRISSYSPKPPISFVKSCGPPSTCAPSLCTSCRSSPRISRMTSPRISLMTSPRISRMSSPRISRMTSRRISRMSSPRISRMTSPKISRTTSLRNSRMTSPRTSRTTSPRTSRMTSPRTSHMTSPRTSRSSSTRYRQSTRTFRSSSQNSSLASSLRLHRSSSRPFKCSSKSTSALEFFNACPQSPSTEVVCDKIQFCNSGNQTCSNEPQFCSTKITACNYLTRSSSTDGRKPCTKIVPTSFCVRVPSSSSSRKACFPSLPRPCSKETACIPRFTASSECQASLFDRYSSCPPFLEKCPFDLPPISCIPPPSCPFTKYTLENFNGTQQCIPLNRPRCYHSEHWTKMGLRLLKASHKGNFCEVRKLLDDGVNVNFTFDSKWTALHRAARMGHSDIVLLLLERGADIHRRTSYLFTALHVAAYYDYTGRCVEVLIAAGADLSARNRSGRTPLHYAAEFGNATAVRALVGAGACIAAMDDVGKTPYDLANTECIRLLLTPRCCP